MPYGHIRQYRELVEEAQSKRLQITKRQRQQIAKLYRDIAKDMGKEISKKSEKTLTYRWLKDYAKALKTQSRQLYDELQGIISLGIWDTAQTVSAVEMEFWGGIVPELSERFRDTFSSIPQTCVDELMNGGIYKDFTGLSERLWNYKQKYDRDIGYIIDRGIIEQKSAYDLAKDLEMYVDPSARKPWEWRKVYPYSNQVVDYNAQRLARTSVTHAYQMSFQRSTVDNPFIEKYKWHSSNAGKTCELCRQRDGKTYDKNMVPLDHPNGMCIVTAEISKSMDEIAEELSSWASGGSNPALDKWLGHQEPLFRKGYSKVDYTFRKSRSSRRAKVYTHKSGTKFIYPDQYDKSLQKIEAFTAMKIYDRVPSELTQYILEIQFVDYSNPDDRYWEQIYGIPGFHSYATGGNKRIVFYENKDDENSKSEILETYLHEGGHIWDNEYEKKYGMRISESEEYKAAMEADCLLSNALYVSSYAEAAKSGIEDFADFIVEYYLDEDYCQAIYPNRTELYRRCLNENSRKNK